MAWRYIMKNYEIKKEVLDKAMTKLAAVNGKQFIAIKPMDLQGVQHLKVAAHNGKIQIEDYIPCACKEVTTEDTIFVPTKFADICRLIVGDTITLQVSENEILVHNSKANMKIALLNAEHQLMISDINEMDSPEEHPVQNENLYRYTVDVAMLYAGLSVYGGMNEKSRTDNSQYDFDGIFIQPNTEESMLEITSTEGHAFSTGKIPYNSFEGTASGQVMPAELPKVLSACSNTGEKGILATVSMQKSLLYVNVGTSLIYFRLKDRNYPNVEKMKGFFETPTLCTVSVDTKELENAIKLIDCSTDEKDKSNNATPIYFIMDGEKLVLKSASGSSTELVAKESSCSGTGETILSYKLLMQLLPLMPQTTTISVKNEMGTTVFNDYAFLLPINPAAAKED